MVLVKYAPETVSSEVDDGYCHILQDSIEESYCLAPGSCGPANCAGYWDGETVCPSCGQLICPNCIRLSDLEDALYGYFR